MCFVYQTVVVEAWSGEKRREENRDDERTKKHGVREDKARRTAHLADRTGTGHGHSCTTRGELHHRHLFCGYSMCMCVCAWDLCLINSKILRFWNILSKARTIQFVKSVKMHFQWTFKMYLLLSLHTILYTTCVLPLSYW